MPRATDSKVSSALREFADTTTTHGFPRAVGSASVVKKICWSVCFAASLAYFLYQANTLFNKYFAYPVATDVSVRFATIDFPAVTICNLNPIRLSKLKTAGGAFSNYIVSDTATALPSTPGPRLKRQVHADQGTVPEFDEDWEDPYQPQEEKRKEQEELRERRGTGSFAGSSDSSSYFDYYGDSSDSGSYYSSQSFDYGDYHDEYELVQNFSSLILELNKTSRRTMGHQYKNLVLECAYNGRSCSSNDFKLRLDEKYGNCYTFNPDKASQRTVKDPGPAHGLQTTLYIEQDEYVPAVTPAAGVRVVIHQPGEWPFPADEGFDVGPGYSTSVGLRVTTIQRLGGKYGECTDGRDRDNLYPSRYSTKTCWYTCLQRLLVEKCGCGSRFIPLPKNTTACPVPIKSCEATWTRVVRGGGICDCPPSCVDNTHSGTFGFSEWPADSYEDSLRQKLSKLKIGKEAAEKLMQGSLDQRRNLLKLSVYFEQLNLQTITESPAYGVENLLGDLGGQLGLWLGVSVMTVLEVVELIVDIIQILLGKARRSKKTDISGPK
ncbi:epithelial sodium channel subunit alpha-like [Branchiostoma floridae x Branchiostoma japonicum]